MMHKAWGNVNGRPNTLAALRMVDPEIRIVLSCPPKSETFRTPTRDTHVKWLWGYDT